MGHRASVCTRFAAAAGLSLASGPPAQDSTPRAEVEDAEVVDDRLEACDAVALAVERKDTRLQVRVTMRRPLAEGMFTCVHLFLDCDDDEDTGISGAELWVRAAVGSRFRPNRWQPALKGVPAPLSVRRASWSAVASHEVVATQDEYTLWQHRGRLNTPRVADREIRFSIPLSLIRKHGSRYGSPTNIRAEIETTCSEQPLAVDHRCRDAGLPIVVDGKDKEWTGSSTRRDPPNELHPSLLFLDLTRLRVDHDGDHLFVFLDLQKNGFADEEPDDMDVYRNDQLVVFLRPLLTKYQKPLLIRVPYGAAEQADTGWRAVVDKTRVELAFDREMAQARFRVLVWSEAKRRDRVPDEGWINLDLRGK